MKSKLIIPVIAMVMLLSEQGKAQFTFSVGTGFQQNSGTFGYKYKNFEPFIGLQLMNASVNYTQSGKEHDTATGDVVNYEDKLKVSGSLILPTLGLKYYFWETGKLKTYGVLSYTKIFISAKIENSNDPDANKDLQEQLKKIRMNAGQLGFGTEYFFDDQFSIGGEFGLMMLRANFKDEFDDEIYDPSTGDMVSFKTITNAKIGLNPSYGRISLNFYFGK